MDITFNPNVTLENFDDYFLRVQTWYNSLNPAHRWWVKTTERNGQIVKDFLFLKKPQRQIARENDLSNTRIMQILDGFLRRARRYDAIRSKDVQTERTNTA